MMRTISSAALPQHRAINCSRRRQAGRCSQHLLLRGAGHPGQGAAHRDRAGHWRREGPRAAAAAEELRPRPSTGYLWTGAARTGGVLSRALRGLLGSGVHELGGSGTNTQVHQNETPGLARTVPPEDNRAAFPRCSLSPPGLGGGVLRQSGACHPQAPMA